MGDAEEGCEQPGEKGAGEQYPAEPPVHGVVPGSEPARQLQRRSQKKDYSA